MVLKPRKILLKLDSAIKTKAFFLIDLPEQRFDEHLSRLKEREESILRDQRRYGDVSQFT